MAEEQVLKEVARGRYETSFDDPSWFRAEDGSRFAAFFLGDEADAPGVFPYEVPPSYRMEAHTHSSHYMSIIVRGSLRVGKKWYHPGDIRLQEAGSLYGPEEAGPEGCLMINIFAKRPGAIPMLLSDDRQPMDPADLKPTVVLKHRWDRGRRVDVG